MMNGFNPYEAYNYNEISDCVDTILKDDSKSVNDKVEEMMALMSNQKKNAFVFFGFTGKLAYRFAMIKDDSDDSSEMEEVKARIYVLDDSVSPSFYSMEHFREFYDKYNSEDKPFIPIQIDEAYSILRSDFKTKSSEQLIEPDDIEEFDDNCNEDCLPGNHTCGKKN